MNKDTAKEFLEYVDKTISVLKKYKAEMLRLFPFVGKEDNGVVYAVGIKDQRGDYDMTNGPWPELQDMLDVIPEGKPAYILKMDGEDTTPLYKWRNGEWRKLKHE